MALHIHYGSSGSGKSFNLYRRILDEADQNRDRNYLVIVPEQFTLQTQKEFVRLSQGGGILNIDVLSFPRLAHRVFEELGGNRRIVLEDTGKSMIVKKVLMDKRSELGIYGGNINRPGFVDEIKSIIAEFYQYSVNDETLDRMEQLAQNRPLMRNKMKDIRIIYNGFRDFLSDKYITNEEILDKLCEVMDDSKLIKGCTVCFDGFTGFTPSQYNLTRRLMCFASDIYVTVTMDARDVTRLLREHDLFYLSYETAGKLRRMAEQAGLDVETRTQDGIPHRFADSPALRHLEHNIFRRPAAHFGAEQDDVVIMSSGSRQDEIALAVCEIKRLVRSGYRYGDIAIISGDVTGYGKTASRELERAGIPYFIDEKQDILKNPLVEMIRALLEIASSDFSYEAVFRFLRCGIRTLLDSETDVLENYVIALGIRGRRRWSKEWRHTYRTSREIDFGQINSLREKVYGILDGVTEKLCDDIVCVRDKLTAIYNLILDTDVAGQLADMFSHEERLSLSRLRKEHENEQVQRLVAEVFERIEALLGDECMDTAEFGSLLDTGFRESKLRSVPPSADSILIGDIERTRLKDIKVMFLLGMNDAIVPKGTMGGGILSDADRELLAENNIELAPTGRRSSYLTEFYLYLNLTKPSEKLYVSYYSMDDSGKPARPSYLVDRVRRLYTTEHGGKTLSYIRTINDRSLAAGSCEGAIDVILGTDRGFSAMTRVLRDCGENSSDVFMALYEMFLAEEPARVNKIMKALRGEGLNEKLDASHARELYGSVLKGSVTRLEQYAACAFSHFLNYGLALEERAVYEFKAPDLGIVYHRSIELFGSALRDEGIGWQELDEDIKERCVSRAVSEAAEGYGNDILTSSGRNEYIITRLGRVVRRTVDVLEKQIRAGAFEPRYYEESFNHAGQYMSLRGKIDRMDVAQKGDKLYLRVIDYKSGSTTFDLQRLYYGLSLQLGVYLTEGTRILRERCGGREVIPAGIFYYNIDDPIVEKSQHSEDDIVKELRLKGITNRESDVLTLMDDSFDDEGGGIKPSVRSSVINVETLKSGEFSKNSMIAGTGQLEALGEFLDDRLHRQGEAIMKGDTSINPFRLDNKTACDYCSYKGVCGFDCGNGSEFRKLEKKADDEIWREICRKTGGQTNSEA